MNKYSMTKPIMAKIKMNEIIIVKIKMVKIFMEKLTMAKLINKYFFYDTTNYEKINYGLNKHKYRNCG